eukprot:SAG31_NODE_20_length_34168_cov_33.651296_36_plen_830_part_00
MRVPLVLASLVPLVEATVTSTSTFERCINDDDVCETKLTMQINLQSGSNAGEEILISQVDDCQTCTAGGTAALNQSVKLTFYHTRPILSYDLYYFADFNAEPKEVVVYGGTGDNGCTCAGPPSLSLAEEDGAGRCTDQCFGVFLGTTCDDRGRSEYVSCGWLYPQSYVANLQRGGRIADVSQLLSVNWISAPMDRVFDRFPNVVPESQGFCCDCTTMDLIFEDMELSRGNIQCNALDSNSPHASAHCLRMDKLWYSSYDIGQSRENYNIYINVQLCDSEGNHCERPGDASIFSVGPERPRIQMDISQDDAEIENAIRVEWAPFGSTDNAIDLTSKMLLRPNCHGNAQCVREYATFISNDGQLTVDEDVINDPHRWLLIDRSDISMTGNDCNQIGILYTGFRNQGENKCIRPYGTCLDKVEVNGRLMSSAKIKDYVLEDMESVVNGMVGRYFPQYLYPASNLAVERNGPDFAALAYEVDEYRVSQLTLIMNGELVSVREFHGHLEVVAAELACMSDDFMPTSCFSNMNGGSIESASNDGLLSVTLRNIGEHPDLYTVSFPSELFEYREEDGSYTRLAEMNSVDLAPIQAKSTDSLPGRQGLTEQCAPGTLFRASVSEMATQCWEDCASAGRRLQGAVGAEASSTTEGCDPGLQCGGRPGPGRVYPDLRDDCDTLTFQVHSQNGLQREYCVTMEVYNALGQREVPNEAYDGRICFNTTEIEYMLVGDAEDAFAAGGEPLRIDPNDFDCSMFCPSTLDFMCMMSQPACQDNFFIVIGVIVFIVLLLCVAKRLGLLKRKKKKEKKKKKKKKRTKSPTVYRMEDIEDADKEDLD